MANSGTTSVVTGDIELPGVASAVGWRIVFTLNRVDTDGAQIIIPQQQVAVVQSDGTITISLWRTARGSANAWYDVTAVSPDSQTTVQVGQVNVPDTASANLNTLLDEFVSEGGFTPPFLTQVQTAVAAAEAAAAESAISAASSESSASAASGFASAAEANAVAVGAPIFADTISGIIGTSNTDLFYVPANGALDIYENDAGAAVYVDTLLDPSFPTRAALVAAVAAGYAPKNGKLVSDGTMQYVASAGATGISDLSGWVPFGIPSPAHFNNVWADFAAYSAGSFGEAKGDFNSPAALAVGGVLSGAGSNITTITRSATGNMINAADADNSRFSGITLDMDRSSLGDAAGHGVSSSGSGLRYSDIRVVDYGSDGVGGGSGILVQPSVATPAPKNIRMSDCEFSPDPLATITIGWIFSDAVYSFATRIYSENVVGGIGYAHELKDNAQYNSLSQLIAADSNVGLAFGQTTAGVDGSDYNVTTNLIAARCDQGLLIGEGFGNITVGMVHDASGGPGNTDVRGVSLTGGAQQNYVSAAQTFGALAETVYISGDKNVVEIASHDTAANIVEFTSGSDKNFVDIRHPGARTSILSVIDDASGNEIDSVNANVVRCDVTGERVGSVSGRFWDKLGASGTTPTSSSKWVYENDNFVFHTFMTPGASGNISGLTVATARDGQTEGRLWHVTGATVADNYWTVGVGGTTDVVRIYNNHVRLGASGPRWQSGTGTPEGAVTAPVGSFYSRTDGGAGTSFYVKESGTGNTGWVAK